MYLEEAIKIIGIDAYFLNKGMRAHFEFTETNMNAEKRLTELESNIYLKLKTAYCEARNSFTHNKTESTAKRFIETYKAYCQFKRMAKFEYVSAADFYEKKVSSPANTAQARASRCRA